MSNKRPRSGSDSAPSAKKPRSRERAHYGLVVALGDEYKELCVVLKEKDVSIEGIDILHTSVRFSRFKFSGQTFIVALAPAVGLQAATMTANALISNFNITVVVSIGISGSCDEDVELGHVVVAERTDHFLHNHKTTTEGTKFGGSEVRADIGLFASARLRAASGSDSITTWKSTFQSEIHFGTVGSSDGVVAADTWKNNILTRNRKLLAFDMESYGVAEACRSDDARNPKPSCFIIRGVQDGANEDKAKDEKQVLDGLTNRERAMQAAVTAFLLFAQEGDLVPKSKGGLAARYIQHVFELSHLGKQKEMIEEALLSLLVAQEKVSVGSFTLIKDTLPSKPPGPSTGKLSKEAFVANSDSAEAEEQWKTVIDQFAASASLTSKQWSSNGGAKDPWDTAFKKVKSTKAPKAPKAPVYQINFSKEEQEAKQEDKREDNQDEMSDDDDDDSEG